MNQKGVNDLQTELGAIRKKLADLEAKQSYCKATTNSMRRRSFFKGIPFGWIQ
jgi:ribosomal protein L29